MKKLKVLSKLEREKILKKVLKTKSITKAIEIKAIIQPIPEDKFIIDQYADSNGNRCFLGHIQEFISGDPLKDWDGFGARQLTSRFIQEQHNENRDGADVNNGPRVNGYTENTPKKRIIHLINDMLKAGY